MAKAHCKNHKRFVPTCDPCKSAALKETVGFPGGRVHQVAEEIMELLPEGGANPDGTTSAAPASAETVNDIPDYEPDEEEAPPAGGGGVPIGGMFPPRGIDETEEAMAAEGEFDTEPPEGQISEAEAAGYPDEPKEPILVPGEGEPKQGPTQMSPLEAAMFMFPRRLIPDGETEIEGRGLVSYEQLISEAVEGYLKLDLSPEDANIIVAAEIIKNEQLNFLPVEDVEAEEEVEEAFDAGLEAAPEITGCIEDYNQGFNEGMKALRTALRTYYAGDEDAPAYSLGLWLDEQMEGLRK